MDLMGRTGPTVLVPGTDEKLIKAQTSFMNELSRKTFSFSPIQRPKVFVLLYRFYVKLVLVNREKWYADNIKSEFSFSCLAPKQTQSGWSKPTICLQRSYRVNDYAKYNLSMGCLWCQASNEGMHPRKIVKATKETKQSPPLKK